MRNLASIALAIALPLAVQAYGRSFCLAQTQKEPGIITGTVKREGKPAPGVTVIASPSLSDPAKAVEQMFNQSASIKATTDSEGVYRMEGLPAGKYSVAPFASPLISAGNNSANEVTVTEGATVENIDFALSPGGVITGRITDGEGRPVIGERISLKPLDKKDAAAGPGLAASIVGDRMYATDDRGIYRIYGLRPGRYIVSTGKESDMMNAFLSQRPKRVQTFYPGVTDETKATPVQVTPGSEAAGVDIQFSGTDKGFVVSGRVVDSEKGTPIAGAMVAYAKAQKPPSDQERTVPDVSIEGVDLPGMPGGFTTTNDKGEFRFASVAPGNYNLEATSIGAISGGSQFYAEPVSFEVKSTNVDKLDIKVHRGAVITGVVVVESADGQDTLERFGQVMLMATVIDSEKSYSGANCLVGADGSFKLGGLKAGKASIRPFSMSSRRPGLLRIERNGVELQEFEIHANEEISGIRVILTSATCVIRGRVTIQGGSLQPGAKLRATARLANADVSGPSDFLGGSPVEVAPNGSFVIENLTPGSYDVEVFTVTQGQRGARTVSAKQTVTVTTQQPAELELVLDLGGKASDK